MKSLRQFGLFGCSGGRGIGINHRTPVWEGIREGEMPWAEFLKLEVRDPDEE